MATNKNNDIDLEKAFKKQIKKVFAVAQLYAGKCEFQAKELQAVGQNQQGSRAGLDTTAIGWFNRTGQAIDSISGYVEKNKEDITFGLMTTVEYGKWLEIANDRKYAIMRPIIFSKAQEFKDRVNEVVGG